MKLSLAVIVAAMALTSCHRGDFDAGPIVADSKSASLGKSEMLRAEIRMGAGELEVEGGGKGEVKASFEFNKGSMEPRFQFDNTSFRARLVIDQKNDNVRIGGDMRNNWRVRLADGVPTDLDIHMGAGEARLNLGSVDLRSVKLGIGAGKVVADFRGTPKRDYEIEIKGGVGECDVTLPKDVGIRAEAHGGIGSIEVDGLEKKDGAWENEAFGSAKAKIRLKVQGGIGEIKIRAN